MKRSVLVMVVLAGLVFSIAIVFFATLDVNRYKPEIIDLVQQRTGRDLEIKGDLFLKLSLIPTVAVERVVFANAPWAAHETMVTVERLEAQAKWLPLLWGRLEIERLTLIAPRISLERNKQGIGNWVIKPGTQARPGDNGRIPQFDLHEVTVRNAVVEYRNAEGHHRDVLIDRLSVRRKRFGQPLALQVNATYDDLPVEISGDIAPLSYLLADEPYAVNLAGRVGGMALSVNGDIEKPVSGVGARLKFDLRADSLTALGELIAQDLPAVGPLSLSGDLSDIAHGYQARDFDLKLGRSDVRGQVDFELEGKVPRMSLRLRSARIDINEIMPAAQKKERGARVFPSAPLPVELLRSVDATVELNIDLLVLPDADLTGVSASMTLNRGKLVVAPFEATIARGLIAGEITIDASPDIPTWRNRAAINDLLLSELSGSAKKNLIEGGRANVSVDLSGKGRSVAEIMANANGHMSIDVGPGTLNNKLLGVASGDLLIDTFHMLNPLAKTDDHTSFECAVVNFAVKGGRAENPTGIGIRTDKLNILGGGSIDLESEDIDIGAKSKPRTGIGINLSSLTDFLRVGGTLSQPVPVTDTAGVATAGLKIGAAVATGGLSILAESLFDRATSDIDVCGVARAEIKPEPRAGESTVERVTDSAKTAIEGAGSTIKETFKGLFGD